jgi:hypothetical protein
MFEPSRKIGRSLKTTKKALNVDSRMIGKHPIADNMSFLAALGGL